MDKLSIFVSYSHYDRQWFVPPDEGQDRERHWLRIPLIPWLANSLTASGIELWYDRGLRPGEEFESIIRAKIAESHVAILLVSEQFLASKFISEIELPLIKERADRGELFIMPIIVEPCVWERINVLKNRLVWPNQIPDNVRSLIDYKRTEEEWKTVRADLLRAILERVDEIRARSASKAEIPAPAHPERGSRATEPKVTAVGNASRVELPVFPTQVASQPVASPTSSGMRGALPKAGGASRVWIGAVVVAAASLVGMWMFKSSDSPESNLPGEHPTALATSVATHTQTRPSPAPASSPVPTPSAPAPPTLSTAQAAAVLNRVPSRLQPLVTLLLQDPDKEIRRKTAEGLGQLGNREVAPALLAALSDVDGVVRQTAVRSLGLLADRQALEQALLTASDKNDRSVAAEELGQLGDKAALPALIAALSDTEAFVAFKVVRSLGQVGQATSVPALETFVAGDEWRDELWYAPPRAAALAIITKFAPERGAESLLKARRSKSSEVRTWAYQNLGWESDPATLQALTSASADSSAKVREAAARAIGKRSEPEAAQALDRFLKDPESSVRSAAVEALSELSRYSELVPPAARPTRDLMAKAFRVHDRGGQIAGDLRIRRNGMSFFSESDSQLSWILWRDVRRWHSARIRPPKGHPCLKEFGDQDLTTLELGVGAPNTKVRKFRWDLCIDPQTDDEVVGLLKRCRPDAQCSASDCVVNE